MIANDELHMRTGTTRSQVIFEADYPGRRRLSNQWQNISDKALTKANSKTTVEIVYPKDVELTGPE